MWTLERLPCKGDELELTIDGRAADGVAIATVEAEVGPQRARRTLVFRAPRCVPGDRIVAAVLRRKSSVFEVRPRRILEPSAERVEARCAHFGFIGQPGRGCGGCSEQALPYEEQVAVKARLVARLLGRAGVDERALRPPIPCHAPWYYRNKMELSAGRGPDGALVLGLHPSGFRYDVLPLRECHLMSEAVSAITPQLGAWLRDRGVQPFEARRGGGFVRTVNFREGKRTGQRMLELVSSGEPTATFDGAERPAEEVARRICERAQELAEALQAPLTSVYWTQWIAEQGRKTELVEHHLAGSATVDEALVVAGRRLEFEIHPRAFFQPNTLQAEVLYAQVIEALAFEGRVGKVLDLYSGTGTIGMCVASAADEVIGVELQPDAVDNARRNAAHNGLDNIGFRCGDVGATLRADPTLLAEVDAIIVDPARRGLSRDALELINTVRSPRLVYVSCNPVALAENLRGLTNWRVDWARPVDMFPHTTHIETVVALVPK